MAIGPFCPVALLTGATDGAGDPSTPAIDGPPTALRRRIGVPPR